MNEIPHFTPASGYEPDGFKVTPTGLFALTDIPQVACGMTEMSPDEGVRSTIFALRSQFGLARMSGCGRLRLSICIQN